MTKQELEKILNKINECRKTCGFEVITPQNEIEYEIFKHFNHLVWTVRDAIEDIGIKRKGENKWINKG